MAAGGTERLGAGRVRLRSEKRSEYCQYFLKSVEWGRLIRHTFRGANALTIVRKEKVKVSRKKNAAEKIVSNLNNNN